MTNNKFKIVGNVPPEMPALGKGLDCFKLFKGKISDDMFESILPMLFAPLGANVSNTKFKYPDNTWKEMCRQIFHLVGDSGIGKGQLSGCTNVIVHRLTEHDEKALKELAGWQTDRQTKGSNQKKQARPEVALWNPPANVTYPAFLLNAHACEVEGNRTQYYNMPEVEMANQMCGSHSCVSQVYRLIFDRQMAGALRATDSGVTCRPVLRVNINVSSTPFAARLFYRNELHNGTVGRIGFSYKAREGRSGKIPIQGEYGEDFIKQVDVYLDKLEACNGTYIVSPLNKLINRLSEDMAKLADLADDDTLWDLGKRSLVNAWKAGCIMYILNDQEWTPAMGHMVEWLVYHDLWSKVQVFGDMFKLSEKTTVSSESSGPKNLLDSLPDSFSESQLEALRTSLGKTKDAKNLLRVWTCRKFIEYSAQTGMYTKTESYLNRKK